MAAYLNKTKPILSKVRECRSIRARSLRSILFLRTTRGYQGFGGVSILQTNKQTNKQRFVRRIYVTTLGARRSRTLRINVRPLPFDNSRNRKFYVIEKSFGIDASI